MTPPSGSTCARAARRDSSVSIQAGWCVAADPRARGSQYVRPYPLLHPSRMKGISTRYLGRSTKERCNVHALFEIFIKKTTGFSGDYYSWSLLVTSRIREYARMTRSFKLMRQTRGAESLTRSEPDSHDLLARKERSKPERLSGRSLRMPSFTILLLDHGSSKRQCQG